MHIKLDHLSVEKKMGVIGKVEMDDIPEGKDKLVRAIEKY